MGVRNNIDGIRKDQGRTTAWILEQFRQRGEKQMTYKRLLAIRKNETSPTLGECFIFIEIFDLGNMTELVYPDDV